MELRVSHLKSHFPKIKKGPKGKSGSLGAFIFDPSGKTIS
jgi:hypothetical protein